MIKRSHGIISWHHGRAYPDRLTRKKNAAYLGLAERLILIYQNGAGQTRCSLHQQVREMLSSETAESRRIPAFCRLLDEQGLFQRRSLTRFRLAVFSLAGEGATRARIAQGMGLAWPEIEKALFADLHPMQRLKSFRGFSGPEDLLARYNVAQLQACLYGAEGLVIDAGGDFKQILRHAHLAQLLHVIQQTCATRFRIELSGPAAVLGNTCQYGIQMARFLPGLLPCRDWRLQARIRGPFHGLADLVLSSQDGFQSHLPPPPEFDSQLEARLAMDFGEHQQGWRLIREGTLLHQGQFTYVPDFVLRHENGREVLLEIAGFWTEDYLSEKQITLKRFQDKEIVIALPIDRAGDQHLWAGRVLLYKNQIKVSELLKIVEEIPSKSL